MTQSFRPQDTQITIETVDFNLLLQLGGLAGNLRNTPDPTVYLTNADNLYWLSRTLWDMNQQYLDDTAIKERNQILADVQKRYKEMKEANDKKLVIRDKGKVGNLTAHLSIHTIRILMGRLQARGLIKERRAFAIAGEQYVHILKDGTIADDEEEGALPQVIEL